MKKLIFKYSILGVILMSVLGCSDKLEDYYENPNGTTEAGVGKLFTTMLYSDYIRPTYWAYRTYKLPVGGVFSKMYGYGVSSRMYIPNVSYTENRWNGFYTGGVLNSYRTMEKIYNESSVEDQEKFEVFIQLGKIILYDQAAHLIDNWGDIPFTEAGAINLTNVVSYAPFDDAESLYLSFIEDLDAINTYLAAVELPSTVATSLNAQDILNDGDLVAWRLYANSLRLKLLMRISNSNEAFAQAEVSAMLADASTYPLVSDNANNVLLRMNTESTTLVSDITNALVEVGPYAGQFLLENVMIANNDPRTDVFWDPGSDGFTGIPTDATEAEVQSLTNTPVSVATYDSLTFLYNWNIPGVLITAAQIDFLKAEAYERWGGGDAEEAYYSGIRHSIDFYYSMSENSTLRNGAPAIAHDKATAPTEDDIAAYLALDNIVYSGDAEAKLSKIGTQKWLNYFILQTDEAWADYRRTGYPALSFELDPYDNEYPPTRLLYPQTEKNYNATNYEKVASQDDDDIRVFWDVD